MGDAVDFGEEKHGSHITLLSDPRGEYTYYRIVTYVPFSNHFTYEHRTLGADRDYRVEVIR